MGQHVRLGERPARCPELVAKVVEEAEIDVDVLVNWTVERADVRGRDTAAGVGRAGEEDGRRARVTAPVPLELACPVGLDAVDVTHDAAIGSSVRGLSAPALGADRRGRLCT